MDALKARAEAGDVEAMYDVGYCYHQLEDFSESVPPVIVAPDFGAAFEWYRKAAARGHGRALFALGTMHEKGKGTPKNLIQALNYYKQAKDKGADFDIYSVYRYLGVNPITRVQAAIAADPALAAAAAEEQRIAENTRKQLALEQETVRLEQEHARLQRDRAALDADKARHEQQVARDRAALEADRARLQSERDAFDAVRREQEAQQQAEEAAAAAFTASQQEAASAKQAEILADRHAEGSNYIPTRNAVAAAWEPTKVQLADCPVHAQPLTPGQSVLLGECLHTICRDCTPHMLQPDNSVRCPVCQAVSSLDANALPPHPFIEAELAAGEAHDCIMCQTAAEDERLPATTKCSSCAPQKLLCEGHVVNHRIRMPTHTTTPLPNGGAAMRCQTHNEPFTAYCMGCRKLICYACTLSTHPAATHPARLLTDTAFVEGLRRRLVEGVAVARTVAEALIDHAADATVAVTELDERDAAIASEIDRTVSVLVGILERRRAAAHDQRLARTRDERAALQTTREESEYHWRIITSAADLAEQLAVGTHLGVNATAVMLQLEAAATARLNAVIVLAPERGVPAPAILRFNFDESVGEQLAELGEIVQDA